MRRAFFILAAIAAMAVTPLAPPAVAGGGGTSTRTVTPFDETFVLPGICGFDVRVHDVGTLIQTDVFDAGGALVGRHRRFPGARETLTNLETGASLTLNTNGPVDTFFHPDGSFTVVFSGPSTIPVAWPDITTPGQSWFTGRAVVEVDSSGHATLVSWHGTARNLCAELSS
jgi:hypothetical protein